MLDTTQDLTATMTRLISTGTTEQALLAAVTHLFPNLSPAELCPAGRADRGGAEGREEALADDANGAQRASPIKVGRLDPHGPAWRGALALPQRGSASTIWPDNTGKKLADRAASVPC